MKLKCPGCGAAIALGTAMSGGLKSTKSCPHCQKAYRGTFSPAVLVIGWIVAFAIGMTLMPELPSDFWSGVVLGLLGVLPVFLAIRLKPQT